MKKSKFLRSSKDMLSRSFNPSKCKTSLRLASSRLKLLRNKKEGQVKQMGREISVLLESGQDQTARIRVEHLIREEKMMAAFDLIGIYCELIVARLPIIESQKICPIDLKEAITSVVFASPRCGDVPELAEAKKQFTEKYGKDFITAAIELRPECGVSRMLVEKLSAVAPDLQTKIKILRAIAEEHNVKWDAESLEQNLTPDSDLLSGPSTFAKESERPVEPLRSQGPEIKAPQSNQYHDSTFFTQVDHRTSLGAERLVSSQVSGFNSSFQHEAKPQGGERAQLFQGDSNTIPRDRRSWNMEFKDATSAAQAAAESAELASMAARAAAELSTRDRMMRQYSTESHNSDDRSLRDGAPADTYMRSNLGSEQYSNDLTNRSFSEHRRLQNEQIERGNTNNAGGRFETGRDSRKEYSHSSSVKSRASTDDDSMDYGVPAVDSYSRKNSLNEVSRGENSVQRQSFKNQAESRVEKSENAREETTGKQNFEYDGGGSSFLGSGKEGKYEEASRKSSRGSAVVFDRSDSDTDNYGFDRSPTYDEPQQGFQLPLSSQKMRSPNPDSWSPKSSGGKTGKPSASVFLIPEPSMDGSKLDDTMTVKFDESDEQSSESEGDVKISSGRDFLSEKKQSVGLQFKDKSRPAFGSPHKGSPQYDQTQLSLSSDYESDDTDGERNQGKKFNPSKPSAHQPTLVAKDNWKELNDVGDSIPEREEGLNFGKLTGGLRHKGFNYPSFGKNQSDAAPSKKESKATTESPRMRTMLERKNTRPDPQPTSDTDSSEEEDVPLQKSSDHKHKLYTLTGGKDLRTKPSFAASNSIFGSENSDLDEDLPKEYLRKTSRLCSGISRRTKAFPSNHEKEKYSKLQPRSEALDPDDGIDGKAITSTSSETPRRYETKRNSSKLESYKQHTSTKVALDHARSGEATSVRMQESKVELRSEAHDSHSRMEQKPTKSYSAEPQQFQSFKGNTPLSSSSKVATKPMNSYSRSGIMQESKLSAKSSAVEEASLPQSKSEPMVDKTSSNKDSGNLKASHVHPKLPDYDSFVQFFQKNRS